MPHISCTLLESLFYFPFINAYTLCRHTYVYTHSYQFPIILYECVRVRPIRSVPSNYMWNWKKLIELNRNRISRYTYMFQVWSADWHANLKLPTNWNKCQLICLLECNPCTCLYELREVDGWVDGGCSRTFIKLSICFAGTHLQLHICVYVYCGLLYCRRNDRNIYWFYIILLYFMITRANIFIICNYLPYIESHPQPPKIRWHVPDKKRTCNINRLLQYSAGILCLIYRHVRATNEIKSDYACMLQLH